MKKVNIKNTDLNVSQICYGTVMLGIERSLGEDFMLLDAFVDAGGNFIDTARMYSDWIPGETGRSERVLGDWLKARNYPKDIVIATKGAHPYLDKYRKPRLKKEEVACDITLSLKSLGVETIDLYYLHRDNENLPVGYILDYLEEFKAKGYLRYYGCSNWKTERIIEARKYAKEKGCSGFSANEMMWHMASSGMKPPEDKTLIVMDESMYAMHEETGLFAMPYSSQAGGYFTSILSKPEKARKLPYHTQENEKRAKELAARFADAKTPAQYVMGYFFGRPFTVVPVFGSNNMAQLKDTIYGAEHPIDPEIEL